MSYTKEVEVVLAVRVEAEATLEKVTSEVVGTTIEAVAATEVGEAMEAVLGDRSLDSSFQVTVKRIPTKGDRPWSQAIGYLAKARAAVGLAWDVVRQD